jgi:hypothetical protein
VHQGLPGVHRLQSDQHNLGVWGARRALIPVSLKVYDGWDWSAPDVVAVTAGSDAGVDDVTEILPGDLRLEAVPNPFNLLTEIVYAIPAGAGTSWVTLDVFDVLGRRVRCLVVGDRGPGAYCVFWDGKGAQGELVAGGIYLCRLTWSGQSETRRIVLSQ